MKIPKLRTKIPKLRTKSPKLRTEIPKLRTKIPKLKKKSYFFLLTFPKHVQNSKLFPDIYPDKMSKYLPLSPIH